MTYTEGNKVKYRGHRTYMTLFSLDKHENMPIHLWGAKQQEAPAKPLKSNVLSSIRAWVKMLIFSIL